jgi:SAM-dependent methyltransferase
VEVIDTIPCYAPELAFSNEDYSPAIFERLFKAEDTNFWFRSRNRVLKYLIRKYTSNSDTTFLEIGCGTGYVLKGLESLPHTELVGADIYLEGLKLTRKRIPGIKLIQLNATQMPFEAKFDSVGAFDVLEHIEEDERVMKEVFKSLKNGGYFFISVPQYSWMWSYLDDMAYHKRRYVRSQLNAKLSRAGFKTVYLGSFLFTLFPLLWISRGLKKSKKMSYTVDDQMKELELSRLTNFLLGCFMRIDEMLIRLGLRLPFGGSLIAVGRKPLS